MPFTLFKFPTLFGRKQNSYKLDRSSVVPIQLDLEAQDPVILCHSKPSFTTFGYNSYYYSLDHPQSFASIKPIQGGSKPKPVMPPSLPTYQYHIKTGDLSEYALEDILKSGFFENESDNNIEKEFTKKHCKKRRPKNPFYVEDEKDMKNGRPSPRIEEDTKMFGSSEDLTDSAGEAGEADKFEELYEELQTETEEGEDLGGEFEEIYENLVVASEQVEEVRGTGSYLPPEIYKLHMESHNQRMGILTKYVEQEEPVYDIWSGDAHHSTGGVEWSTGPVSESGGWCQVEALQWPPSLRLEDRLDFIPSKQTDVIEESGEGQPLYQVPRAVRKVELSRPGEMMAGSESDCDSMDSGLETGNSNLETSEPGFLDGEETDSATDSFDKPEVSESPLSDLSESIYENAAVLKSASMLTPVTNTIEKYEFGQMDEDDVEVEERVAETGDTFEAVSFQDLEVFEKPSEPVKKSWGVRRESLSQSQLQRTNNPTEEKIAKEIRELKEREEELIRAREMKDRPDSREEEQVVEQEQEEQKEEEEEEDHSSPSLSPGLEYSVRPQQTQQAKKEDKTRSEKRFNPNLYRPVILPPRPGIMQTFIANRGKVTAFKKPTETVVQLRKPQVYKSVPKVSPPVGSSVTRQSPGNVLDKIQAELAETKRREDELRRARREMFRSQPDLSQVREEAATTEAEEAEEGGDQQSDSDSEEDTLSLLHTRGKSALISVWENRIQCEKAA